jgi:hypothetical protein
MNLRGRVDRQIGQWIGHRALMTGLCSQIEDPLPPLHNLLKRLGVAHIEYPCFDAARAALQIARISTVPLEQIVDRQYLCTERIEPSHEIGANKTHAACDQHRLTQLMGG